MRQTRRMSLDAAGLLLTSRRNMSDFIPGLRLSAEFFREAVAPILAAEYQGVPYSAALIGSGSEVFGFDTEMSSDHHWGPRVMLFLRDSGSRPLSCRAAPIAWRTTAAHVSGLSHQLHAAESRRQRHTVLRPQTPADQSSRGHSYRARFLAGLLEL